MISSVNPNSKSGIVYTFYSFKGGVGRSMALANCAALLAKWGHRVLMVDWDLEAPGLERFFASVEGSDVVEARTKTAGVVDLIAAWSTSEKLDWRSCTIGIPVSNGKSKLDLISAGRSDSEYPGKLHTLDFPKLFEETDLGSYIEVLRDEWAAAYDFILIDSRTGVTDIGGICTVHLADVLILLFTTTDSSVLGLSRIVKSARAARGKFPRDRAALVAVPVPARDESRTEYRQSQEWKQKTAKAFRGLYEDWLPASVKAEDAVEILRIPYVPYWSFGERLPVIEEGTKDPSSLGRAYEMLARLLASRLDWSEAVEVAAVPGRRYSMHVIDQEWLAEQRASRERKHNLFFVKGINPGNYFEAHYYCEEAFSVRDQRALLDLAKRAEILAGGQIGVIRSGEENRPKPRLSGIQAEVTNEKDVNYWAISSDLDFFCRVTRIEPQESEYISFRSTAKLVAELLLHSYRLFSLAETSQSSKIHLSVIQSGLRGRRLDVDSETAFGYVSDGRAAENIVSTSVSFSLEDLKADFAGKLMELCDPLVVLFDFHKISKERYEVVASMYRPYLRIGE